ncbi:unnamed protein product [Candida verbasci]|uniref:ER membrane protein complex subunit 7 beta-sandwich domain-containing protein n=1 Tax=Candida verbasci TaxID=1227364 RepID=A0A9W4TUP2_9ASCO|nr:unnamed protein product [Candida verbasci]
MLFSILYYIAVCAAIGFTGEIVNVPSSINELYHHKSKSIPNGNNYQSRIKLDLYKLNDKFNKIDFSSKSATLDRNYKFKFNDLLPGEYELIINSYDFVIEPYQYKINITDDESIVAFKHEFGITNETSIQSIINSPLLFQFTDFKQFYEKSSNSVYDMLLNSPFGFIFRNRVYTMIFTVCLGIMITPYILQWVNPEFAEQLKEIQVQEAHSRLGEKVVQPDAESIPIRNPQNKLKKRRS